MRIQKRNIKDSKSKIVISFKDIPFLIVLILVSSQIFAQTNPIIDNLYRNSYKVFEMQRLPNGMYRDSKLFSGVDYHPISVSNTGIGLISLCIADANSWISNADELALNTLKTVNGHNSSFIPDRTVNGYFRHFLDVNTGAQAWNSEYSTIDTDILVCGALFAMKYFQSDSINAYALELWNSIDFEAAISNPELGRIFLTMNENGTGVTNSFTIPYNEYMIVAWLAMNSSSATETPGHQLWNNFYSSPDLLPKSNYNGIDILSDNVNSYLSSFTHQFNYYLCNYYTNSSEYYLYFHNSQKADSSWWSQNTVNHHEWGLGAGSAITTAYHADAINNNPDIIVSPHIIAGYLPVNPNGKNNLLEIWNNNNGIYTLPDNDNSKIMWRYSLSDSLWEPNEVIGIDYSTMLFGLSTLPEYLGSTFFQENNNYFPLDAQDIIEITSVNIIYSHPNPCYSKLIIEGITPDTNYRIINALGEIITNGSINCNNEIDISNLVNGIYIINFGNSRIIKFIKA